MRPGGHKAVSNSLGGVSRLFRITFENVLSTPTPPYIATTNYTCSESVNQRHSSEARRAQSCLKQSRRGLQALPPNVLSTPTPPYIATTNYTCSKSVNQRHSSESRRPQSYLKQSRRGLQTLPYRFHRTFSQHPLPHI